MRKFFFKTLRLLTLNYYLKRKQKNTLLIFIFHQVNDKKTTFYPAMPVSAFSKLCQFVNNNYEVIPLSEIKSHFNKTNKPAAVISFDDAHYDIVENALPVLKALDLPFIINVDTELLETGKPQDFVRVYDILNHTQIDTYFNPAFMNKPIVIDRLNPINTENEFTELLSNATTQQKRETTDDLALRAGMADKDFSRMMTKRDVELLSRQNVEFGSHSHTHSILTKISPEQIHYELSHSKNILESITNKKIDVLAYPNGIYNDEVEELAQELGYTVFLQSDNEINHVLPNNDPVNSYTRINQYHQTLDEALAHTYGVIKTIKKIIG
jgi:peptidoglycan/xylan/chitin deacetylase (PgdA/CDA1 family)